MADLWYNQILYSCPKNQYDTISWWNLRFTPLLGILEPTGVNLCGSMLPRIHKAPSNLHCDFVLLGNHSANCCWRTSLLGGRMIIWLLNYAQHTIYEWLSINKWLHFFVAALLYETLLGIYGNSFMTAISNFKPWFSAPCRPLAVLKSLYNTPCVADCLTLTHVRLIPAAPSEEGAAVLPIKTAAR